MMNTALDTFLIQHLPHLRIVCAAGEAARVVTKQLSYAIAECHIGPFEHVQWLDAIAKNLPKDGPVRLVKVSKTSTMLEVTTGDETVRFPLWFGSRDSDSTYLVHRKGRETYDRAGLQGVLFDWNAHQTTLPDVVHPYALRIIKRTETGDAFELHFVLGAQPHQEEAMSSRIPHYDAFIVTLPNDKTPTTETFTVPFDPEGRY